MSHKFSKNKSGRQASISTASLPDIVFMLLFFFMVATVMREVELKINVSVPNASEAKKSRAQKFGELYLRWQAYRAIPSNLRA